MTVRSTSIEAYHTSASSRATQVERVLAILKAAGRPMTRRQLSIESGVEFCSVPDRVSQLMGEGLVAELPEKAPCPTSGRNVFWVYATAKQGELAL